MTVPEYSGKFISLCSDINRHNLYKLLQILDNFVILWTIPIEPLVSVKHFIFKHKKTYQYQQHEIKWLDSLMQLLMTWKAWTLAQKLVREPAHGKTIHSFGYKNYCSGSITEINIAKTVGKNEIEIQNIYIEVL